MLSSITSEAYHKPEYLSGLRSTTMIDLDQTQRASSAEPTRQHVVPPDLLNTPGAEPPAPYSAPMPHARPLERVRRRRRFLDRYTPRAIGVGLGAGLMGVALLGSMALAGVYGYYQLGEQVVPGVYIVDVPLGGMSRAEVAATVDTIWNAQRGLIVSDGERNWYAAPEEFGLSVHADATAQRALDVGRGGNLVTELSQMADSFMNGYRVSPVVVLDGEAARAGLIRWADQINKPPQNAGITLEDGRIKPTPGVAGHVLDVEATLAVLADDPGYAIADGYLPLVLIPVAPAIADSSAAVAQAESLLRAPLEIVVFDPILNERSTHVVEPSVLAGWLAAQDGADGLEIVVNQGAAAQYLEEIQAGLGQGRTLDSAQAAIQVAEAVGGADPAKLIVKHLPTVYTVEQGDTLLSVGWKNGMPFWRIIDANPGMTTETKLNAGDIITIPSRSDLLPLPVVMNKRMVVDIGDQRLVIYQDEQVLNTFVISTGIDRSPTQPGVFQVQTRVENAYASIWDLWMPDFLGIYEAWPGFMNGFHGLPTLSSGVTLWADVLGRPASFGCIILDLDASAFLFDWAEEGTVVEIVE